MYESYEDYLLTKYIALGGGLVFAICFLWREIKQKVAEWILRDVIKGHF